MRAVVPVALAIVLLGLLVTLGWSLWAVVGGLAVLTAGFFAAHGVASGWVAARATYVGRGTAQATSLYMFAYYLGSSVCGTDATAVDFRDVTAPKRLEEARDLFVATTTVSPDAAAAPTAG